MSENTKIQWADHTFNPWIGCTKVSAGCAHCYAEARDKRHLIEPVDHWGKDAPRLRTSAANWRLPVKWNKTAGRSRLFNGGVFEEGGSTQTVGRPQSYRIVGYSQDPGCRVHFTRADWEAAPRPRPRVFCASLADWLDKEVPIEWLADLLRLIHDTPNLDWLLLTKRPENWRPRLMAVLKLITDGSGKDAQFWQMCCDWVGGKPPANVWLGVSVEDQTRADERIPKLLSIPAKVRFLSMEPLLGPVKLEALRRSEAWPKPEIDWVIIGGESGPNARPCKVEWIRSLVEQCRLNDAAPFVKQLGGVVIEDRCMCPGTLDGGPDCKVCGARRFLADIKGGHPAEWTEDLRVREFPVSP